MRYKRRFVDQAIQNAYENACDCHRYGYSRVYWEDCGIPKEMKKSVWEQAYEDVANDSL